MIRALLLSILPIMAYSNHAMHMEDMDMGDVMNGSAFELMVTYTFLTAREGGLAVSYDPRIDNDSSLTSPAIDPRSGVKIGASYTFDNRLELSFVYAWFYNMGNPYERAPMPTMSDANSVYSTWGFFNLTSFTAVNSMFVDGLSSSVWNNAFNRVDLLLSKSIYCTSRLILRPSMGMVFAWDVQEYMASYGYVTMRLSTTNTLVAEWINTQDWYGVGPYVGLCPSFILWASKDSSIAICSKGGAALTWSRADAKMLHRPTITSGGFELQYDNIFFYVSPMVDIFLGLSWRSCLDRWSIRASVGWEQEVWFGHNRIFGVNNYPSRNGIYSIQGLNVSIGAGF